ncbi:MAG: hypothetical protein IPP91_13000 [Betaproteobacteria bacterium]|nr:hypothetical protein [Betaproteobacteria bacterium]
MNRLLLATLLIPLGALAGPYDQPWVIIATDTAPSADPELKPVIVNRVDGQNSIRNQVVTLPGPHMVTVDLPPRKGFKIGTQETFDLETSACMRYFIAAKLDTPVTQAWKPMVRRSELIGECATKFKSGAAAK